MIAATLVTGDQNRNRLLDKSGCGSEEDSRQFSCRIGRRIVFDSSRATSERLKRDLQQFGLRVVQLSPNAPTCNAVISVGPTGSLVFIEAASSGAKGRRRLAENEGSNVTSE